MGVSRTASPEEIRQAYRKLSIKFHPDKNDGDKFFEDRFKEINEAYEVLANSTKRTAYDALSANHTNKQQQNHTSQQSSETPPPPHPDPPKIVSFTADKTAAALNDVITFKWQVENASTVELKPFGTVPKTGSKAVKVLGWNSEKGLEIELKAYNVTNNNSITRRITLPKGVTVSDTKTAHDAPINSVSGKPSRDPNNKSGGVITPLGLILAMLTLALFITEAGRKISKSHTEETTTGTVTDQMPLSTNQTYTTTPDNPVTETLTPAVEAISPWKGNQLKNGNSPFSSCFGDDGRSGSSWILFQNQNRVDAVVCLVNSISGGTIRNEYIKAGAEFEMSNVPVGTYYIKVLYGNDWNPNLSSPCGSKGFFESDVSFSVSDGYNDVINVETFDDGSSIRYSTHTIKLYPVVDGNMSQRGIDASQFFGQ